MELLDSMDDHSIQDIAIRSWVNGGQDRAFIGSCSQENAVVEFASWRLQDCTAEMCGQTKLDRIAEQNY